MKVPTDVLAVLDACTTKGPALTLPASLERPLYVRTVKVLQAAGGKWNRQAKAHLFPGEAADAIEQVLLTGQITTHQEVGYFPTPPAVAARLLDLANLEPGMLVLEPSAGTGEMVRAIRRRGGWVDAVELDWRRAGVIEGTRNLRVGDFLDFRPEYVTPWLEHLPPTLYDRVVMNPPFARQADIDHVTHALQFLRPGGRLVSVMSAGVLFRQGKAATFRDLVDSRVGWFEKLPSGSFRPSGTEVEAVLVAIPA